MMAFKGQIVIDTEHCKGCGVCLEACPMHCIELSKNVNGKGYNYTHVVNENCIGCASCAIVCPDGVISVYKVKC
ncbi:MAG: ferredoxin family protein [Bacteroidales bacterium]|nr:ferredoxin family protein [Bacteroidales bacterium]MBQ6068034.1 ferredoxin family protein [Bacteroidales bacterium]